MSQLITGVIKEELKRIHIFRIIFMVNFLTFHDRSRRLANLDGFWFLTVSLI